MNNHIEAEEQKKETTLIRENLEDEYWSKKYGVSSEDLKKTGNNIGLSAKIIAATFKKKSYSL
jgi:hypothetical protein